MKQYIIIELDYTSIMGIYEIIQCDTSHDVANHMWGRSLGTHLIYKNNKLAYLAHNYPNMSDLETYLESIK